MKQNDPNKNIVDIKSECFMFEYVGHLKRIYILNLYKTFYILIL